MAGQDEQTLIRAAQGGDLNAFNGLVLTYQDIVYTVCYRIIGDAESAADAAQESFLTAYRRLETYRGGNFRSWLLRLTTNTCYDLLRYHKRRPAAYLDDLTPEDSDDEPPIPDAASTPEQATLENELSTAIQRCIQALSEDQRVVLVMNDIEGYSYQDIADTLNTQLGTVKSRLSRARTNVRRCLQGVKELLPSAYRLED
ncbi:MAG: sigma-70 family RNA polymerase sigma factor [Anaerolineae bacterium]